MSVQRLSVQSGRCCACRSSSTGAVFGSRRTVARRAHLSTRQVVCAAVTEGPKYAEEVTDATFEEKVLKSSVPVLVDFWAPWCGPCRMITSIIDEVAVEYKDKLKCTKLNTDENPAIAQAYSIRSIPTVMIFKDGVKMESVIGAVPKATIALTVDKYV